MDQGSEWRTRAEERQSAVRRLLARLLSAGWSIAAGSLAALGVSVIFLGAALPALRIMAITFTIAGLVFGVARIIAIKREISRLIQLPALDLRDAPSEIVATLPPEVLLPDQATSIEHLDLILSVDLPAQSQKLSTRANQRRALAIHLVGALGVLLCLIALAILLLWVSSPTSGSLSLALSLCALSAALPALLNTSALTALHQVQTISTARRLISAQVLLGLNELPDGGGKLAVLVREQERISVDPNMFPHVMHQHRKIARWLRGRPPRLARTLVQAWLYAATGAIAGTMAIVVTLAAVTQ
jgi:hypothetical protein